MENKDYPLSDETLFKMNGTLMEKGELGRNIKKIADTLEKMNWNLGTIAKALTRISEK